MESLWRKEAGRIEPSLHVTQGEIKKAHWDVVVIGAGMAGILIAYYLQRQGKKVLIVEAKTIASGQTEGTTAKITSQHGMKYTELIKNIGEEKAKLYAQANERAISQYARLVKDEKIECQFERVDSFLYSTSRDMILKQEAKDAEKLGIYAEFVTETELPMKIKGAVRFREQAQFQPLSFIREVSKQLNILEQTLVTEVKDNWIVTNRGILTADDIVVATHYPICDIPGWYFLRQHQERSYVLALKGAKKIKNIYYGIDENGLSFRQAGEYLLVGGCNHRTGYVYNKRAGSSCEGAYEHLRKVTKEYYKDAKEIACWSAQDCMPHDGIPFIGRYSIFTPHLYVATGFQKWGMTTSMIAAQLICDAICEKENLYQKVFTPQRFLVRAGIKAWSKDVGISSINLIKGLGSKKRCSHMGCALSWNPQTQSWDCPCHGSRYDKEGKVLDNPAKKDIS